MEPLIEKDRMVSPPLSASLGASLFGDLINLLGDEVTDGRPKVDMHAEQLPVGSHFVGANHEHPHLDARFMHLFRQDGTPLRVFADTISSRNWTPCLILRLNLACVQHSGQVRNPKIPRYVCSLTYRRIAR